MTNTAKPTDADAEYDELMTGDDLPYLQPRTEAQQHRQAMGQPSDADIPTVLSLRDLANLPEMRDPPVVVVPRMALEGRVTLFAAQEKSGKSTLTGEAVAALSSGQTFLGRPCVAGRVLWLAYDEPLEDCVRRLVEMGADLDRVWLTDYRLTWNQLQDTITRCQPDLLVIDTLTEYAVSEGIEDLNSARQWTPILARLREECRVNRMAAILLHHFTKAARGYADSRAMGAGVDIILEMYAGHDDARLRLVKYRGRGMGHGDFRMSFANGRYQLQKSEW